MRVWLFFDNKFSYLQYIKIRNIMIYNYENNEVSNKNNAARWAAKYGVSGREMKKWIDKIAKELKMYNPNILLITSSPS